MVASPFFAGLSDKVGCLIFHIFFCKVFWFFKVSVTIFDILYLDCVGLNSDI